MVLIGSIVAALLLALSISHVSRRKLVVVVVQGLSMVPTYQPGDRVLVIRGKVPAAGDIVVVEQPSMETAGWPSTPAGLGGGSGDVQSRPWLLKRVVGAPGDRVPTQASGPLHTAAGVVPPGSFFLLGDNADVSFDSRQMGWFPLERVLGTVYRRTDSG
ncbi:S26 family signal peptidase [Streptomyces sp. NPDC093544]|uniref:S26 family signal peptidase n=1 Tax=Streptomyces sp. NPDC093544 TaxID=3155200 RepID=UPI0034402AAE